MALRQTSTHVLQQTQLAVAVALRPSVSQQAASASAAALAAAAASTTVPCALPSSLAAPVVATKQLTTPTSVHQRRAAAVGKPVGLRNLQVCSPKLAVLIEGAAHNHTVNSSCLPAGTCVNGTMQARGFSRPWGSSRCRGKRGARRAQSCIFPRLSSVRTAPDSCLNPATIVSTGLGDAKAAANEYSKTGRTTNKVTAELSPRRVEPVARARLAKTASAAVVAPAIPRVAAVSMRSMPAVFRVGGGLHSGSHILCYGDSLTAGFCSHGRQYEPYGRTLADAIHAGLEDSTPVEVAVCGHSGSTAAEMVANLDSTSVEDIGGMVGKGLRRILQDAAPSRRPDLVLLMAGTNDLGKLKSHTAIFDDLRSLHAVCHVLGVRSVALAPPPAPFAARGHPWEVERQRLVARLAGWAQSERGVAAFIDPGEFLPAFGAAELWETDGLHLSPAGSRQLGRCLAQRLVPLLRQPVSVTCRAQVSQTSKPRALSKERQVNEVAAT
mmetsp:Transcript_127015/g.247493  ORF Transcript_127015/g.247493 Transcript_127015/m.247493 type:complete len:496 (-) Transcript_127015:233-1720(-)|eukprot:CAMPEP_0172724928 /NCGR_PEP_ID=MMETSP1074-20121228/87180_1 /TAXON_ID=2916 /ORGANISM="Ceratium fusus, Strain PA161109" /LENGTH=495 /DNA_ID=CAMNT_0013551563 /DNA_START=58 /DNA_END=1545 /DNA_ORIENTATION=+